jgi:hypothetical protein
MSWDDDSPQWGLRVIVATVLAVLQFLVLWHYASGQMSLEVRLLLCGATWLLVVLFGRHLVTFLPDLISWP